MRKIESYAQECFDGDIQAAIEFLLTGDHGDAKYIFDQYVDELTLEESKFAMRIIRREVHKTLQDKKFRRLIRVEKYLEFLHMTKEEILSAERNPYAHQLWWYCAGFCGLVTLVTVTFFYPNMLADWMDVVVYAGVLFLFYELVPQWIKWKRFRFVRRYASEYNANMEDQRFVQE